MCIKGFEYLFLITKWVKASNLLHCLPVPYLPLKASAAEILHQQKTLYGNANDSAPKTFMGLATVAN